MLGQHAAELAANSPVAAQEGDIAAALSPAAGDTSTVAPEDSALEVETADAAASAEQPEKEVPKATVSLRLVAFEAAKKISVIKEVRAMLGEGLKESKELV